MANVIKHTGSVIAIDSEMVRVRIEQTSACSACQAKAMCSSADKKEKIIDIALQNTSAPAPVTPFERGAGGFKVGDRVEVLIEPRMGWKAVIIAYLLPLMVLVVTLAVLDMRLENEALAGVIALSVTGVYFIVLRLFRDKLQRQFSFSVRKIED